MKLGYLSSFAVLATVVSCGASADENFLGHVKGAEVLPKGASDLYMKVNWRSDKGQGNYDAVDIFAEYEYGVSDRFQFGVGVKGRSVDTEGLLIDGYLPKEGNFGPKLAGLEVTGKYMFLSPALDDFGLASYVTLDYDWMDPHSGQDKNTLSLELELIGQKYFLEGQLIWMGNLSVEGTYSDRGALEGLPADFEWPTDPEMELEITAGTGVSYRFAPNWFIGAEIEYQTEFETEVGQERYSWFAGPSLHYGGQSMWATLTWLPQISGGGEMYEGQLDTGLHLIEKTKNEVIFKIGFNF
ncbi:DUF6662 family protein [Kordiimonas aestuarii]|uniref:DUF6662 family protein n=1 Tax=Kordiimonas aestuarii TaxID=1005925 RepID=UPI0021D33C52|nr:DUF6662 family protein [Kordiimonas aestuarii]